MRINRTLNVICFASIAIAVLTPMATAQSTDCWTGSFRSSESFWGTYNYSGTMTVAFDSQQWRELPSAEAGKYVIGTATLTESCSGTRKVEANEPEECSVSIDNQRGAAELQVGTGDNGIVLTLSGDPSSDIRTGYGVNTTASWLRVEISGSEITSTLSFNGEEGAGELRLAKSNCDGSGDEQERQAQSDAPPPPQRGYTQPAPQAPPPPPAASRETAAERNADQLLNSADQLLAQAGQSGTYPPVKGRLTYIAFANHNGLTSDGTFGVGESYGDPNQADAFALHNCNVSITGGAPQCSSNGDCSLLTGQWAAYAIATGPFMTADGPYLSATSCGLSTMTAAWAQALQACQANGGGTMACNVVWSDVGK